MTEEDFDADAAEELSRRFAMALRNRDGRPAGIDLRMLEKTPKNSLRVPLLAKIYPDAQFLFLHREARPTISSMIEAWQSGRFRTYPRLPDWHGLPWSLLLVPGWQALRNQSLAQIVAHQWQTTINILISDLEALPEDRVLVTSYERLHSNPQATIQEICDQLSLEWDRDLPKKLPVSRFTVSPPQSDKWRRHEKEIEQVWHTVSKANDRATHFFESRSIAQK
jgi:hypothetical protein